MSGSTGANRIKKEDVQPTINHYITNVLSKYPGYLGKYAITGSYTVGKKSDYGDIDLVVLMKGTDKALAKKDFANWLVSNFKDNPELLKPFVSNNYKDKLFLNTGEIITIHYPQFEKDFGCQIDNMFALSEDEFYFKQKFLNLPAEIQGLVLGLVKISTIEESLISIFKRLNITEPTKLIPNFEYEFNLSGKELQLRKVELDNSFKQLSRSVVWSSEKWDDVILLLKDYNLNSDFNSLLSTIKSKIKNKRSSNRILGIFTSMISVKSGEVGTEKGMQKLRAISDVENTFKESLILSFSEFLKI